MSDHLPNRKRMRLYGFDYSQLCVVFLTICSKDKIPLFSRVILQDESAEIQLTEIGIAIQNTLNELKPRYPSVEIIESVIMPNHIHLLLKIDSDPESTPRIHNSILARYISSLKRYTNRISKKKLWQSRSFDHIIRNREDFDEHIRYIRDNPKKWLSDEWFSE